MTEPSALPDPDEALHTAQAYFRMATRISKLGWWTISLPERKLTWSDETCLMHDAPPGYEPTLAGGVLTFLPEHRAMVARHVDLCASEGIPYEFIASKLTLKGRKIWVHCFGEAVRDASGAIVRLQGAFQDITEKRRAEARAVAELENRVQQRTAELEIANRELLAANRELEAFSYSVSHDLRAPLSTINGFSRLLARVEAHRLDETSKHYLNRIELGTRNMGELIEGLLSLAQLSRKKLHMETVDLSALAQQTAQVFRDAEPARVAEVGIEPGLAASGDRVLLTAVMQNLVGNAWKFSARREVVHLAFGSQPGEGGECVYFLRDRGAGFDMAFYGKLFGTFERLHSPTDFTGTGVGLATVKRIIERHGGRVWAEGVPGEGAVFYFTLGQAPS
ncbi:MAG: ATP-binding protein [Pseudomonadota bacterium]